MLIWDSPRIEIKLIYFYKVAGAGVGIGLVFGSLIEATARNPSLRPQLFAYAILGFALAEATLRRCRYFIRLLIYKLVLKYIYLIKASIDQIGAGLTRVASANELMLQGLGISEIYIKPSSMIYYGKNIIIYCIISRSECSVIVSSLTKVNCHIKTGSSAKVLSWVLVTLKNKRQQDLGCVLVGSIRSSCPEQARTRNIIQDCILNNEILNTGNPGKISDSFETKIIEVESLYLQIIIYHVLVKLNVHYDYLKRDLLSSKTINLSRLKNQEIIYRYGGKIVEKANAPSNFGDNVSKSKNINLLNTHINMRKEDVLIYKSVYKEIKYFGTKMFHYSDMLHLGARSQFRSLYKIRNVLCSQRLNSTMFIRSNNIKCFSVRNYSQIPYREIYSEGKFSKEEKILIWNKCNWGDISESVREKQVKLAETATKFNIYDKRVVKLQEALALSLEFRLLAVYNVSNNKGSKTPGEDGILLTDDRSKGNMVGELKIILINTKLKDYKSGLIRRVYIPKSNGKLRPLGIPNIKDRCLQELIRLILDPVVEPFSDKHSYGFRKYRSAKNAIGAIRVTLQSSEHKDCKYIFDADIKGFFDHINHSWLLSNIPIGKHHKRILKSWLKAGILQKGYKEKELLYPQEGTPQGSIISPLLGNFTLNGLEKVVLDSIKSIVPNQFQALKVKKKDGTRSTIRLGVKCIRYADDFVIIARNKRILTNYIKPAVVEFLKERGLTLSEEKTKIFGIRNEPLDFLGYRFKYQNKWKKSYSMFKEKIGRSGIALYPQKENLLDIIKKIQKIIYKSSNSSSYTLITELNPIIRGWSNYNNLGESTYYRNKLRYYLYQLCWRWAKKKHPRWGKKRIALTYFLGEGPFKGRKWNFRGSTFHNSRFTNSQEGKVTYLIDPTVVVNTVSGIKLVIPETIINIHAYDKDYLKLVEFQTQINCMSLGKEESYKGKLFKKQKGICVICNKPLLVDTFLKLGTLHLDHIQPISEGGSKTNMKNLRLIHIWCHKVVHFGKE